MVTVIESSKDLTVAGAVCLHYFWHSNVAVFKMFLSVRAYGETTRVQFPLHCVELGWWNGVKKIWSSARDPVQHLLPEFLMHGITSKHVPPPTIPATCSSVTAVFPFASSSFNASFGSTSIWRQINIVVISGHSSVNAFYWDFYAENILCMSLASCFSVFIIEHVNVGPLLCVAVFDFILFQYSLQILSPCDSSSYPALWLCPFRTPELFICMQAFCFVRVFVYQGC